MGAVTGLNATENNLKMTTVVMAPFLVMWFTIKLFLPDEWYDVSVTVAMLGWLVWVVVLWAWAKSDAGNYICFPQAKMKFPDGSCRTFDFKVPPDSWEKIVTFSDGSTGYRVFASEKYLIDDPNLPYPIVFDTMFWLLPQDWDVAFQRRAYGEFFHKGVFVTKPDCEDISLYVIGYEERDGSKFPVCVVNDCAWRYFETLKSMDVPNLMRASNPIYLLYQAERKRGIRLLQHTAYVEDGLDVAQKEGSIDFKKEADNRLKQVRGRHASIMDTRESLMSRILNLKTFAIIVGAVAIVYFIGHFLIGVF